MPVIVLRKWMFLLRSKAIIIKQKSADFISFGAYAIFDFKRILPSNSCFILVKKVRNVIINKRYHSGDTLD